MKQLTSPFIFSALVFASVTILGFTASVSGITETKPEMENITPLTPNYDFYACITFPLCSDPDDAEPLYQHLIASDQAKTV